MSFRTITEEERKAALERSECYQQRISEAARRFLQTAEDLQLTWNEFEQVIQVVKSKAKIIAKT